MTSSTRPKLPGQAGGAGNKSGSASLPFGSTSSISSSSSSRSWADTVKGLKAPRSVEDLKTASSSILSPYNNFSSSSNKKEINVVLANFDQPLLDDGGWKTVKSRIRSKYSPAALKNKTNNVLNSSSNHESNLNSTIKTNSGTKTASSNNLIESDEDSEIVKKDEAIAKVEQEEKSLQREIRETEKSEMPLGKRNKEAQNI